MKAEEYQAKHDSPSFFNGLALGAVVGAAGFFLFGTKKGKKLKKALLESSTKTFDNLKRTAKDLEKKGRKISKKATVKRAQLEKKAAATQKKVVKEIKQTEKQLKTAQKKAETLKKRLAKAAQTAKKRYFTRRGRSLGK